MKPYPKYKDSGVGWIGEIPHQWEVNKLKFIANANPSNIDKKSKEDEKEILLCNYVDVYKNDFIDQHLTFMKATATDEQISKFILEKNDVIATKDSESPDDIGNPALVKEKLQNVVCGYHLTHIKPIKVNGQFLFRYLQSRYMQSYFEVSANGITRYGLGVDKFNSALILNPPLEEQQQISNFLDHKTHQIDTLIEKKKRLIDLLKEERTAVINEAVTKGLDPDVPMKDSGIEWLGEIPEHWDVVRNFALFKQVDDRGYPDLPILQVSINSGVTVREFSEDKIETVASDFNTYKRAKCGFIAFNKMRMWQGAVGVTPIDGLVSPDYTVAKPYPNVNSEYFAMQFRHPNYSVEIDRHSHGIVKDRNRLYWDGFKQLRTVCPPYIEQNEIIEYILKISNAFDTTITKTTKEIELLQEYRTALISEVVTGKIDVRDWKEPEITC